MGELSGLIKRGDTSSFNLVTSIRRLDRILNGKFKLDKHSGTDFYRFPVKNTLITVRSFVFHANTASKRDALPILFSGGPWAGIFI